MATDIVHISDEGGLVVLWGGPIYVDADNIDPQDQALLDQYSLVLTHLWERTGDDGMFWRRRMLLFGVEIIAVILKDGKPHVQLPYESWLVLDTDGENLADQAVVYGIYGTHDIREVPVAPQSSLTWLALARYEPGFSVTGSEEE